MELNGGKWRKMEANGTPWSKRLPREYLGRLINRFGNVLAIFKKKVLNTVSQFKQLSLNFDPPLLVNVDSQYKS